jgi:hypothetical protein
MARKALLISLLLHSIYIFSIEVKIDLLKTIGDEKQDNTFFLLSSAVMNNNKEIYICDMNGHFIAKYDFNRGLIKRIGRMGQGPGDFNMPRSISVHNKNILILDAGNNRIVEADMDLNHFTYTKPSIHLFQNLFTLANNMFLSTSHLQKKNDDIVSIIDSNGNITKKFFNDNPMNGEFDKLNQFQIIHLGSWTSLKMATDQNRDNIFISFYYPSNPIQFYLYSKDGILLKKFKYLLDAKYKFPEYYLTNPIKYPEKSCIVNIDSVFIHKKYFVVFMNRFEMEGNTTVKDEHSIILFDEKGKLVAEKNIDVQYVYFYLSEDGYLLARKAEREDIEKLYIFKLNIH